MEQTPHFGTKLKELRLQKGLKIRELESLTGISNAYLSQIENGKRKRPSPEYLKRMAPHLNIPYASLLQLAGHLSEDEPIPSISNRLFRYDFLPDDYEQDHILLEVIDESMRGSRIHKGDKVVVKKQQEIEEGDVAAIEVEGEALVKKMKHYPDGTTWWVSTHEDFPPIPFHPSIRIIGKAVHVLFKP